MKDLRGCLMKFSKTRMKVKILGTRGKIEESTPRHSQNSGERGRAPLKKLLFVQRHLHVQINYMLFYINWRVHIW